MGLDLARIQAICLDVDGTLSDTDDVWAEKLTRSLSPLAGLFPRRDLAPIVRRLILEAESPGNLAYSLLDRFGLDDEVGRLFDYLARRRARVLPGHFRLIRGVDSLLPSLAARYPLAVVSARGEGSTLAFLDQFGLRPFLRCVATAQTCAHTKPFPDPILWAAERMGVAPSACLMVGDTTVDIRAARAAGAQSVGVLCGFGEERELRRAGADAILPETAELEALLYISPRPERFT